MWYMMMIMLTTFSSTVAYPCRSTTEAGSIKTSKVAVTKFKWQAAATINNNGKKIHLTGTKTDTF